jgi:hypothetical protein
LSEKADPLSRLVKQHFQTQHQLRARVIVIDKRKM